MGAPGTPPPTEVVVGLDVGTTGTKAVAFAPGSSWRHAAVREYPLEHPEPGQAVQDPDVVVDRALDALAEAVRAVADPSRVVGVAVSTAMHGLLGLDADHRPLTPLLTWADARAEDQAREWRDTALGQRLHRLTGTPLHPMSPFAKLAWFRRNDDRIAADVRWWVGLKDWILWHLAGRLTTELSSASGTGLLDRHRGEWSPMAAELAGIDVDRLPPVASPLATLPLSADAAARTGLPAGTPVVLGAGDGPLGNLATGATVPGVLGMSIGTSGAVRAMVARPPDDLPPSLFAYALVEDAWVVGGAVSNGGVVTRWIADTLAPDLVSGTHPEGPRDEGQDAPGRARPSPPTSPPGHDEAVLALAAAVPPGSDGLVMLPHLLPERAPLWDPSLEGAWLGLRRDHTRGHLVRAAVEGVALQLALVADRIADVAPFTEARATGGVLQSPLWREVLAAMLDRPVTVPTASGGTALGAAALGLVALDRAAGLDEAVASLTHDRGREHVQAPDPATVAAYHRLRSRVPALVEAMRAYTDLVAASGRPHGPREG